MKLAIIGHGAMGQLVESQARTAGDQIGVKLTSQDTGSDIEGIAEKLRGHDVAIDFSVSEAVLRNIEASALAGVPLVEGTTGWKECLTRAKEIVSERQGALVYGANFSLGVNLFYRIVRDAARAFAGVDQYQPFIEEQHHARKRDAPSGTALQLQKLMSEFIKENIPVASTRAGHIPGTHRVGFDSAADQITLTHMARSREGFAAGALLAARWIIGRKGVYEFSEVVDQILGVTEK
jgi:4-hydroxy-tetrahydrodipicolinate reductase